MMLIIKSVHLINLHFWTHLKEGQTRIFNQKTGISKIIMTNYQLKNKPKKLHMDTCWVKHDQLKLSRE